MLLSPFHRLVPKPCPESRVRKRSWPPRPRGGGRRDCLLRPRVNVPSCAGTPRNWVRGSARRRARPVVQWKCFSEVPACAQTSRGDSALAPTSGVWGGGGPCPPSRSWGLKCSFCIENPLLFPAEDLRSKERGRWDGASRQPRRKEGGARGHPEGDWERGCGPCLIRGADLATAEGF